MHALASGILTLLLAVTTSGCSLWGWGDNADRQLGDGTTTTRTTPIQIDTAEWDAIADGQTHSCGIRHDSTLWCWGTNTLGELGDGTTTTRSRPVPIGAATWASVSVGYTHSCALRSDEKLWCWGDNTNGQLGDGTKTTRLAPVRIGTASWKSLSAGGRHTCAIRADDTLWCWGANAQGQLGDGSTTPRTAPVPIPGATWTTVSTGEAHTCGIRTDATLWCWGRNSDGRLGIGSVVSQSSPVRVGATHWKGVAAGGSHTCGIQNDNSLWCWGRDDAGQVGDGAPLADQHSPVSLNSEAYTTVAAGASHSCAIRVDTTLWCWGRNTQGQLGDGTTSGSLAPRQVGEHGQWQSVAAGASHTHALLRTGESTTPIFEARQLYREPAPGGIDAEFAATVPGGKGERVRIADVEYDWHFAHEDLERARAPGAFILNGTFQSSFDAEHGTAVLGVLVGDDNPFGVAGVVPNAELRMINASDDGFWALAEAIDLARQNLAPGDVLLLEQQAPGPDGSYVPVEWIPQFYDAIVAATSAGIIVVEAAGNGAANLGDRSLYGNPFPSGRPDSGAIIVGAGIGITPECGGYARSRSFTSTYGPRVNVQGWGKCVTTAGYGDLYSTGPNASYTSIFNGTSSASAIVAAAVAAVSSAREQSGRAPLTSRQMRDLLVATGTPQDTTSPGVLTGNIGPLPNIKAAIQTTAPPPPANDASTLDRRVLSKPAHTDIPPGYSHSSIVVKLVDGADLDAVRAVVHDVPVTPLFRTPAATLRRQTETIAQRSGREQAELDLYYRVALPPEAHSEAIIDALNALPSVELAAAAPLPPPLPVARP